MSNALGGQETFATDRRWAALYPPGNDVLADSKETMVSLFRKTVREHGQSNALTYFDGQTDYATLDRQSDAFGSWLVECGVVQGQRVMIVAQNVPAFAVAVIAAWKLGAVAVPANPMYRASELARIFADAAPAAVLCQVADEDEVAEGLTLAGLGHVPLAVLSPHHGQTLDDSRVLPKAGKASRGASYETIIETPLSAPLPEVVINPEDIGLILYTSGTTGAPKGAMIRHSSMTCNALFTQRWCGIAADSRILAIAPFFHITGLVCHLCTAVASGASMIMNYRFEPGLVVEMIRRWQPTFTIGAITAFNALSLTKDVTREDMASLRSVFSGGAPVPPALKADIEDRLGIFINPCYGMTETAAPATFSPPGAQAPVLDGALSIGIPTPGTTVVILGDDGKPAPAGAPGEICMHGPQIMAGYWNKPDETSEALRDGWMYSGDIGVMDEQGWVFLVDRKKDVIIASGFKVWPREVEDVIYAHPAVREVAVIGVEDAYRGENVKAIVSLKSGASVTAEELVKHCRASLAAYKVPRLVEFLDDLPKTVSGKIQRQALRG